MPAPLGVRQSWCAIDEDGSRYLLSDFAGGLHLLVLAHADNRVAGIKVQTLGELMSGEGDAGRLSWLFVQLWVKVAGLLAPRCRH
jgi:hypothetical protein